METLSLILLGLAFIFFCLMSAILVRQNEQLRKDLKDAYHKLNQLKK